MASSYTFGNGNGQRVTIDGATEEEFKKNFVQYLIDSRWGWSEYESFAGNAPVLTPQERDAIKTYTLNQATPEQLKLVSQTLGTEPDFSHLVDSSMQLQGDSRTTVLSDTFGKETVETYIADKGTPTPLYGAEPAPFTDAKAPIVPTQSTTLPPASAPVTPQPTPAPVTVPAPTAPPLPASTSPTAPITSANLTSSTPINYQSPNPPPAYPVASLGAAPTPGVSPTGQLSLTPEEQKAQDYTTKLQDLNNQLIGQSSYRTEQENAQGLTSLNQTKTDLTSQLNALKNEAMAIPLQAQQQSEGRGITAGGLRPIETAAARNNAIQALTVNSLLEATNGNISTALLMVDRAVAQKFDPIKEQIDVAQRNLELILNSPQASVEDKNRALAQQQIQQAKSEQLAYDQEQFKNVQKVAIDAAAAGVDALTLNRIQAAKTAVEATQIAAQAGVYKTPEQDQVQKIAMDAAASGASAQVIQQIQSAKDPVQAAQIAAGAGVYSNDAEVNKSTIQKIAMEAAAGGASQATLNQILAAPDPVQATKIAADAGVYTAPTTAAQAAEDKILSPSDAEKLGVPYGTTVSQAAAMGIVPGSTETEAPKQLSASEIKTYQELGYQVQPGMTQADVANAPYSPPPEPPPKPADTISTAEYNQLIAAGYTGITPLMSEADAKAAVAAQQKPAAPTGYPTTNLQPGSTDAAAVKQLQTWLVANGYMSATDMATGPGIYGPKTTAAVAKVQQQYGVDNTGAVGYWGPKTLTALKGGAPTPITKTSTSSTQSFGSITNADESKGMNWLLANGASQEEINLFKTDREFQALILQSAKAADANLDDY